MFLSRIELDILRDETMRAISSPQILHATLENCFNQKNRTLWRLDSLNGKRFLLVVSQVAPSFEPLAKQLCRDGETGHVKNYSTFLAAIKNGQQLRFRLRGNTVHSLTPEQGKRGKVVPHITEHHKREWLVKKAASNGFLLEESKFGMVECGQQRFFRNKKAVDISHATFEGVLTVENAEIFVAALTNGIGRGKAYGCGLMTVIAI